MTTSNKAAPDQELLKQCAAIVEARKYDQWTVDTANEIALAIIRLAQAAQAKEFAEWCETAFASTASSQGVFHSGFHAALDQAAAHARSLMEKADG